MKDFLYTTWAGFVIYCLPFVICFIIAGLVTWVATR
jgi:hypothetical protein